MFPGVDGFHWSAGHLIFLSVFFTVLAVIATTLCTACIRAGRDMQAHNIARLRWAGEFHDLPKPDRACRHQITGEFRHRICKLKFDCHECETHAQLVEKQPVEAVAGEYNILGLSFPQDRMYHRGHTWAKVGEDGTVTIGLDELGRRLVGTPDSVELPPAGSRIEVNGTAWRMKKSGAAVRVLSAVEGEVVETGDTESGWYLRVKPTDGATTHLLRGVEVSAWTRRELEKLQLLMAGDSTGATLADGGVMVEDVSRMCPADKWDTVLSGMFLES